MKSIKGVERIICAIAVFFIIFAAITAIICLCVIRNTKTQVEEVEREYALKLHSTIAEYESKLNGSSGGTPEFYFKEAAVKSISAMSDNSWFVEWDTGSDRVVFFTAETIELKRDKAYILTVYSNNTPDTFDDVIMNVWESVY